MKQGILPDFPATRGAYVRMTRAVRDLTDGLPLGAAILRVPTYACAAAYLLSLLLLLLRQDARIVRALLVPAACFLAATALRPAIDRKRPYDRFDAPPVGRYRRGKGKSMPSRHTASAAAIAFAVIYAFPGWPLGVCMTALCLAIGALRVLSGQHYLGDVLAAILLSALLSAVGYIL